jgi:hypothetical protein
MVWYALKVLERSESVAEDKGFIGNIPTPFHRVSSLGSGGIRQTYTSVSSW